MTTNNLLAAVAAVIGLGASAALAGEPVIVPVVEQVPVIPAPQAAPQWAGGYVGGALGYSFRGRDEIGLELRSDDAVLDRATGLGNLSLSGPTASLHAGYRWQRGAWVFGPELSIEGGSVKDDRLVTAELPVVDEAGATVESRMRSVTSLVAKTGYAIDDRTLVFGTLGLSNYRGTYRFSGADASLTERYSLSGWTAGLGVERMVSERMSVFGALEYREFGRRTVDFGLEDGDVLRTIATPKHANIKLGVNFRF